MNESLRNSLSNLSESKILTVFQFLDESYNKSILKSHNRLISIKNQADGVNSYLYYFDFIKYN